MEQKIEIWLIRHGKTPENEQHRYIGWLDSSLGSAGKAELIRASETVSKVWVTNRRRTQETAQILFPGAKQILVPGLEEMNFGSFEGKNFEEMQNDQDLIKRIVEVAAMPQFTGKIIFLQNYDMELARRMVQGVDVWLNTPTRPLEASGTSGEKAVMNGVLQFSVLDGWWVEGYKKGGGWMLPMERTFENQDFQNEMDAELIYNTIEEEIAPLYYRRDENNVPHDWVESIKVCVADIAANFTTNRMLNDYEERFYRKLHERHERMVAEDFRMAREIAAWKRRVSSAWDKVHVVNTEQFNMDKEAILIGHGYDVEVVVDIDGLRPEDIGVEMILADQITDNKNVRVIAKRELTFVRQDGSRAFYSVRSTPESTGSFDMAIRVFPKNDKLPHRMDFALVKWA